MKNAADKADYEHLVLKHEAERAFNQGTHAEWQDANARLVLKSKQLVAIQGWTDDDAAAADRGDKTAQAKILESMAFIAKTMDSKTAFDKKFEDAQRQSKIAFRAACLIEAIRMHSETQEERREIVTGEETNDHYTVNAVKGLLASPCLISIHSIRR